MKKVIIAAVLSVTANLVLANEFINKVNQQDNPAPVTQSHEEIIALEELSAGINANVHML